jgi:hypothetical protein
MPADQDGHRQLLINGQRTKNDDDFERLSPRDYLRGKTWDERTRIGIRALIEHGVLEP